MLAHSPPLPLIIHHGDRNHELSAEDEKGIMFSLQHRDRVRCIYLEKSVPCLQKLVKAMDDQSPILEYLHIAPLTEQGAPLVLPSTFEAPQLRILVLEQVASPIGSPLLTTAIGLVRLSLRWVHPLTNLYPDHLFQALSHLPQLQNLMITFSSRVPNPEIERQLLRMPTHITLPNLRALTFRGVSAYLGPLLSHVNAPLLDMLTFSFLRQLSRSVPHLGQFVMTAVNLRSSRVLFLFYHEAVAAFIHRSVSAHSPALVFHICCDHLDWQVSSMAQMFNVLSPFCSTVVDLTLDYRSHPLLSESHNQAERTQWRELLESFRNVETLRVHDGLVGELSRCLDLNGEPHSEILPKLKTLICPMGSRDDKTFATFVHDREVAGLPIDIIEDVFPTGKMKYKLWRPAGVEYIS